jgi:hypothetical protein
MEDYYKTLGIPSNASLKEIKDRYKFLVHAYHPDKFASDDHKLEAHEEFKRIDEAYRTLCDVRKRADYDKQRNAKAEYYSEAQQRPRNKSSSKPKQQPNEPTGEQKARAAAEKARQDAEKAKPSFLKNLFNTGKCVVGVHKGDWFYDVAAQCLQVQICELCDAKSTRTEHVWPEWRFQSGNTCQRVRVCNRCGEVEQSVEHMWSHWEYVYENDCTQVQICGRCKEKSPHTRVYHDWREPSHREFDNMPVTACRRCLEILPEPNLPGKYVTSGKPHTISGPPSLSGIWLAGDGLPVQFHQIGNRVSIRGVNVYGVVVVQGQGVVQGTQVQLEFQYYDGYVYDQGQTVMQIATNGQQMDGIVRYMMSGMSRPMRLVKQIR